MFGAAPVPNPGADLYNAAAKGNMEGAQRLIQANAPLDFKIVRHRPALAARALSVARQGG